MTAILTIAAPDPNIVVALRLKAARMIHDGRQTPAAQRYIMSCGAYHEPTLAFILFTREHGFNSGGWWKNPDYERCYHLSLSFLAYERGEPLTLPYNWTMARRWVEAFFAAAAKFTWHEGPVTGAGKQNGVHHYRLFCDPAWQPVKPRGEVYNRDWTPADWKSFSDIHGDPA